MSLARRLSTIRLRNPFTWRSRAKKSQQAQNNASRAVIEDREDIPQPTSNGQEDESHYKQLKNRPRRKSMCFCCEKQFTVIENFLSLGTRKCTTCQKRICKSCANIGGCHVCGAKRTLDLDPDNLMQLERKDLVAVLNTLHFPDVNFIHWPKEYLVKQLLTRLEVREDWDPAEARTHTSRTDKRPKRFENMDLNELQYQKANPRKSSKAVEMPRKLSESVDTPSGKCVENPEAGPGSSKLETVRQKQLQDPDSRNVAGIPNEDLCKVCMDFPINCILLDCGHLVVCIYCSDLIHECPICRKPIARVIQTKMS